MKWDTSVIKVDWIERGALPVVRLHLRANTIMTFTYKQYDRPRQTSLITTAVKSSFFKQAGGSWRYESFDQRTLWTQTNSIELKDSFMLRLLKPLLKQFFLWQTQQAMKLAKKQIEETHADGHS